MAIAQSAISRELMRKRKDIEKDGKLRELLILEVLLDIRDTLVKAIKKKK